MSLEPGEIAEAESDLADAIIKHFQDKHPHLAGNAGSFDWKTFAQTVIQIIETLAPIIGPLIGSK